MDWSIHQVARLTGSTTRTLRHYDAIGLLPPSRLGSNGYRYYDERALLRLQRILLLRELGLSLPAIAGVLAEHTEASTALREHRDWLGQEQARLRRQITAVDRTIAALEKGETLMPEILFDGFDHTHHREEVEQRWGERAYAAGDAWWNGLSDTERTNWRTDAEALGNDWVATWRSGAEPDDDAAQALARRHHEWLSAIPGTPSENGRAPRAYYLGLADMYVADERFAKNYGGTEGAEFARAAMRIWAERNLKE